MKLSLERIIVQAIRDEKHRICAGSNGITWYLFGSVLTTKRPVGDIDLLVVCEDGSDCRRIRSELDAVCLQYPIHLMVMSSAEENELQFIESEGAVDIEVINLRDVL